MIVVASLDENSITTTRKIGIVPFADGELLLKHEGSAKRVQAIAHFFGGREQAIDIEIPKNGLVKIPLREHLDNNALVEWIEINFDK